MHQEVWATTGCAHNYDAALEAIETVAAAAIEAGVTGYIRKARGDAADSLATRIPRAGTGFGLGIVRVIAEAHGWRAAAAESDTGGARIGFRDVAQLSEED